MVRTGEYGVPQALLLEFPLGHAGNGRLINPNNEEQRHVERPTLVGVISELTVMSRNGCDQMNLNAESRMAARVRSDLATLATGCGRTRGGEDNFVKCDTVSYYNDIMSLNHLVLCRIRVGLQTLSMVAAVFLPLSFISGVMGMNTAGLLGNENTMAFWVVVALMLLTGIYWHALTLSLSPDLSLHPPSGQSLPACCGGWQSLRAGSIRH
jgi:CorA-like Mg2+ transporter protein